MKRNIHRIVSLLLAAAMLIPMLPSLPARVHAEETSNILSLRYDDRYDITGKTVEIVDPGTPTSYKVGYGVAQGTLDDAVITLDGDKLIATGIGTAQVKIDGMLYEITVEAAPISLLLILGQSNAEGMEGNANQSIVCPDGQVYSTYAKANGLTGDAGLTVENAGNYIPSALTGPYSTVNINGTDTKLSAYPVNSLTEAGAGKYGMDSGLAYEWVRQTGEKVWVINAAHGASSITSWQKGAENYDQAVALFTACQKVLQMEIIAGHYTFSHMGYYWNQGCADETRSAQWYAERYIAMHENLKQDLACDMDNDTTTADNTLEFGNIVLVQAGHSTATGYRKGTYTDTSDSFFMTYKELELRGPRVAQIWMANNPELPDIHIVCTLAQDWVTMLDGSDGVAEYFHAAYKNGIVDYTTQVKQSDSWYAPTTPAAVKDSIHYNQIGYNEIGRESARNTLYILGILEKPQVETRVTFLDWTGYQQAGSIKTSAVGTSDTLVVPLVYPCYESKTVTYTLSGGLAWTYYDLLDTETDGGTLTASVGTQTVKVIGREFYNYRFELVDDILVSVSDINFRENLLTATASGTYTLSDPILLKHDNPWVVEFNSVEADRFMALSSTSRASDGMFYFFKSKSGSGVLSLGEYKDGLYQNYGLKQSSIAIDWTQPHVYQFRNVINDDGSNTIHIFIDNKWVGTATNLIINDVLQSTDNMYLSGKDLTFTSIGCNGFALSTNQMTYLQVYEEGLIPLSLCYDDRYDITGKTVEIVDAGTPTSYKVGYGVTQGTLDDAVITLDGDKLIATGIGTAQVKIDGVLYEITVEAAPISLILLAGQSNMRGSEGNADQSIVCPDGMVYATYGDDRGADNTAMTVSNAAHFAPSALTGEYSNINTVGTTDCLSGYPVYSLTEAGGGKIGPDSGFAYEWVKQTGEKVWIVNAAHGGTSIKVWQPGTTEYEQCQALFTACQQTLQQEIAAGHYTLSHMGYFWCQGCSDYSQTAQWYVEKYLTMHNSLKSELAFDHDSDPATPDKPFEFGGIIPVRAGHESYTSYRQGVYTDTTSKAYHESFEDLRFTGPRVAQYWMINNPELEDIWGVCNIGEDWVWMPDGTNGVTEYFQAHYENGTVDYTTQVTQKASWYTPTTPKAVHDSIHYNQIGYNEIGRESVRNALILLGEIEAPDVETTVELMTWDGYTEATRIPASTAGNSATLVVPVVYPIWKSKNVTYELSEGLTWNYYDLLADDTQTTGVLTAGDKSVTVVKAEPGAHFAEHLSQLPEDVCCGLNLWPLLEHDEYYFASGTSWQIYSSGDVYSVTIPVNPGDLIYATSFGKAGTNGHATSNGIRTTFFSDYGVAKTMAPAEVYAEFSANGGYIVAPEGAVAINIAMWSNSDDNEIYILNLPHDTTNDTCSICGKSSHTHTWSDWQTVTEPGPDGPGIDQRTCACGETETREIISIWQTSNLAQYIQQLPENTCRGLNLWAVLNHDSTYYVTGKGDWGYHSSRDVPSITIPVNPGDMIFATSFGAADVNGHGSANGIRVTWFDIEGVLKTTAPADTYAEFSKNGGYLIAPEGAIAINIPLWGDIDSHEVYILNREHTYKSTYTEPTCTEAGYVTHICTTCGDTYTDGYVDALWHTYDNGLCSDCGCDMVRVTIHDIIRYQGGVSAEDGTLNTTFTNNWYTNIRIPVGAEQVRFLTFKTGAHWGSAFFGETGFLSGFCDASVGGQWVTLEIPNGATQLRYGYLYDQIAQNNGWELFRYVEFAGQAMEDWEPSPYMERPATGCHSFSVDVNVAPAMGDPDGSVIGTDYGYIMLPTNYSAYGEPTRLIIVCHGAGASLGTYQSDAWKTNNYSFWTDLGYAVMDMYACPQELSGSDSCLHYGNPVVLDCYKAGYDYVMEHFNLKRDGIYVVGSSMGGLSSFQIVQSELFPVLAQVAYCPVIDLYKQAYCNPWTTASYQRSRIASYFGFSGPMPKFTDTKFPSAEEIEFYKQNFDKTIPYSPILRNVVSGDMTSIFLAAPTSATASDAAEAALYAQLTATHPCPLMIFHNTNDATVSYRYSQYFVDMVNRSGQEAILYTFTSGGHNAWANGSDVTLEGINGQISIKESQYQAYLFFNQMETHESHYAWVDPAVEATCTQSGLSEGSHCAACGEILKAQEVVEAEGHTYISTVTPPTCTEQGYTTHTCATCGDSYVDSYAEPTGQHSYENGLCTGCGIHLPGDVNGDGEVNNKDITRLFQYLSDYDVEVVEEAMDVNGDGSVNNKDLTRLFQYLSDYEVELH